MKTTALTLTVALLLGALVLPAAAETASPSQRAEFSKLLSQRNALATRLTQLDRQAADKMKQGEEAAIIHAQQVAAQDQLDLVQLRLELLATRLGLALPPVPDPDAVASPGSDPVANRASLALARGKARTLATMRQDCLRLLKSLDFSKFVTY